MRLLLSGALHYLSEQRSIQKSLGGFMSSTGFPNGRINAVFSDVSSYAQNVESKECIAFFLLNDTKEPIKNLKIKQVVRADFKCEFEWAAVEPAMGETISMEQIGSIKEEPFDADWFSPTSIREFAYLKAKAPGAIGDTVDLLGVEVDLTGTTLKSLVDDIFLGFKDNEDFYLERIDDENFFIERKSFTITNDVIELITPGSAELFDANFSGGEDGTTELVDELKPNEALGFWLKRKVNKLTCESPSCEELSCIKNTKESLEVFFIYD